MTRDSDHPGYNTSSHFPEAFSGSVPGLGRHGPIVSPGMEAVPRSGSEYRYPAAHHPWPEPAYPSSLPASSEACSIGHSASGGESTEGRSEVHEIVTGSPNSADFQPQYPCAAEGYQRGEHYLPNPMYPVPRGREIPGNSPNPPSAVRPIDSSSPYQVPPYAHNAEYYQQHGDRLPPPPPLAASGPYYPRDLNERLQVAGAYPHGDVTGVPPEAATSPTSATVSPPNSRALFHLHRPGQSVPGAPYYGQAPNASPYYHQEGGAPEMRPHMAINPHHAIADVTTKHSLMSSLSPSVNQSAYASK